MPRIVRFHETGPADVLVLEEVPLQQPGRGEVRLRVEAIGLNRTEVMYRQGRYLETPEFPSRIGYEAAGTVDALGPDVEGVQIGDRVSTIPSFSMRTYGVYGESAVVPAASVAPYPPTLSAVEGAAIWMQYLTAYGALIEYGRLRADDAVVIAAASSSVGLAAIQITRAGGSRRHRDDPRRREEGCPPRPRCRSCRGDGRGEPGRAGQGDHLRNQRLHPLRPGRRALPRDAGRRGGGGGNDLRIYGALSAQPTPFPLFAALGKGLTVRGYTLFEIVRDAAALRRGKLYVYDGLGAGTLKPVIDRTFPLAAIADAHRYMESNRQLGKIVITV